MGAWGTGIFDNDTAADWTYGLADDGFALIDATLRAVLADVGFIDSDDATCALAAADVVARFISGRGADSAYIGAVTEWFATLPGVPTPELVALALKAVAVVRGDESELAELWAETDANDEWLSTLVDLESRLGHPASDRPAGSHG